jgi:ABC-type dipeptide/oligopeptide/nickel transport system ATPase subunit
MTARLDANTQVLSWQAVLAHVRAHRVGLLVVSHEAPLLARSCQPVTSMAPLSAAPEGDSIANSLPPRAHVVHSQYAFSSHGLNDKNLRS